MPIRRVLVTGGAGYIGSHLVDALVARGYEVTVFDNLEPQVHRSGDWPVYANPRVAYHRGDVRDREALTPLVLAADAIVHFAAAVSVGQSMYQVDRYVGVNTGATGLLLDILVNQKHSVQKLIVASSVGVYGEGAYRCPACGPQAPGLRPVEQLETRDWEPRCPSCGRSLEPAATHEDKLLHRDNIYAMTKYHQEEMALLVGRTYGIPTVTPRFFNVYGPRQSLSNPYAGVAAIFLGRLLNDKAPVVFEDGGQLRDFVSIRDVVDCLVLMLERSGADYLPVNIGSGSRITILEIAKTLARLTGKSIEPQVLDTGRTFDIRHCVADISRARETLGYAPKVSFDEGMAELIAWAQSSPERPVDLFDKALAELNQHGLLAGGRS
jgi:dTDP-L-rhamnose 4-epimerase